VDCTGPDGEPILERQAAEYGERRAEGKRARDVEAFALQHLTGV